MIVGESGRLSAIARIVGQVRVRWPKTCIVLRAESGFCRESLMRRCEKNRADYVFGLARNARLVRAIGAELKSAETESARTQRPARRFRELDYQTRKSWSRSRRVVAKSRAYG